jgi:hypothetical protein
MPSVAEDLGGGGGEVVEGDGEFGVRGEVLCGGVRFRVAVKRFTSEAVFVVWHGGRVLGFGEAEQSRVEQVILDFVEAQHDVEVE